MLCRRGSGVRAGGRALQLLHRHSLISDYGSAHRHLSYFGRWRSASYCWQTAVRRTAGRQQYDTDSTTSTNMTAVRSLGSSHGQAVTEDAAAYSQQAAESKVHAAPAAPTARPPATWKRTPGRSPSARGAMGGRRAAGSRPPPQLQRSCSRTLRGARQSSPSRCICVGCISV